MNSDSLDTIVYGLGIEGLSVGLNSILTVTKHDTQNVSIIACTSTLFNHLNYTEL